MVKLPAHFVRPYVRMQAAWQRLQFCVGLQRTTPVEPPGEGVIVMPEPKGDKLFVNLGASQARRRLKGFGHGVRKVQSNGRNQAVIIHTAKGRNLHELERKFADVGFAHAQNELHEPINNLPNLGPTSAAWLRDAGIATISELVRLGPVLAYQLVRQRQPRASLNLLWALAAGLENRDWREMSKEEKAKLQSEIEKADLR